MAATSPSHPTGTSSYVAMLVDDRDGGGDALTALETIHEAGSTSHAATAETAPHDGAVASPARARDEAPASPLQQQQQQQRPVGREIAFRVSTPDRIRRRSEQLYSEVHAMIDRHESRTGRERELQRRESRNSRVVAAGLAGRDVSRRHDGPPSRELVAASPHVPLPDLHHMFEESRQAYLTEAQQHRTYFPSTSKPTMYSSKDPSTFSYRFQSFDAASTGQ